MLILVDTLRRDAVGFHGAVEPDGRTLTPNWDELADESVVFEDCLSPSSWTWASMASILSGEPPTVHGVNSVNSVVPGELTLLSERLKEAGWWTAGFVANPVLDLANLLMGQNLMESKLSKLPALERQKANSYMGAKVSKGFYAIMERKGRMKEAVEKTFKSVKTSLSSLKDQKIEVTAKKLRALKIVLCHDYCQDVLARSLSMQAK